MELITLRVGERSQVVLTGLGTAGFRWSATVDQPEFVSVERVNRVHTGGNPPGSWSSAEEFSLISLAVGETIVHFTQARSFEPDKPPRAVREMVVRVLAQ